MASSPLGSTIEGLGADAGSQKRDSDGQGNGYICKVGRLQELNLSLTQRNNDTMGRLSSRSDREAREALTLLNEDLKKQNGALMAFMTQLAAHNRSLREILKKSEDGRAAVSMQKAAQVLVKGLANAEEEVQGLRGKLKEVTAQRDRYKDRLAKTNAEMTSSHARAQIVRMLPGGGFSGSTRAQGVGSHKRPTGATDDASVPRELPPSHASSMRILPGMHNINMLGNLSSSATPGLGMSSTKRTSTVGVLAGAGGDIGDRAGVPRGGSSMGKWGASATGHGSREARKQKRERDSAIDDNDLDDAPGSEAQSAYDSEEAPSMFF